MSDIEAEILLNQAHIMAALAVVVAATSIIPEGPRNGMGHNLTQAAERTAAMVKSAKLS